MAFRDLTGVLEFLRATGRLAEVGGPVSVRHEVAALLHVASRQHRAVHVGRTDRGPLPVVGNVLCHDEVLALGLGVPSEQAGRAFVERCTAEVPPRTGTDGPVLERSIEPAEIGEFLPVLTHYEGDSGAFLTTAVVSAVDPRTGAVARGVHRMEQRGPDRFGVALLNPPLSDVYAQARAAGRPLAAAVTLGHEPLTFLAAALKGRAGEDKMAAAGALRGEPVDLVSAPHTGIPVPAEAEILLEGEIDPSDERPDGPFGEISGYHVSFSATPTFVVKSARCRQSPLYHALLPTGWEADRLLGMVAEASVQALVGPAPVEVTAVRAVPFSYGASVVVRLAPATPDRIRAFLEILLRETRVKQVVAVAEDVDVEDPWDVEWSVVSRSQPDRDWVILPGLRGQPIDPSAHEHAVTAKAAVDATGYHRVPGRRARVPQGALERCRAFLTRRER
ncbi:UbiD family decarboxylase [Deferrisoma camini]|uniref:UbiD family decarboxylase n=1 Tax=Deferrisoma camini TaxID=1035120 RepID=UPI00046C9940|nr:UbiD family decarboxylase [Deferrisoma camini]